MTKRKQKKMQQSKEKLGQVHSDDLQRARKREEEEIQPGSDSHEKSDSNTDHDWCTCNCLGECKGRLVWEVESTRYFWKRTVVSHPWYRPYFAESVMSLSCGIAAETWLRIPRKITGEDHTIIMVDLEAPVKPE